MVGCVTTNRLRKTGERKVQLFTNNSTIKLFSCWFSSLFGKVFFQFLCVFPVPLTWDVLFSSWAYEWYVNVHVFLFRCCFFVNLNFVLSVKLWPSDILWCACCSCELWVFLWVRDEKCFSVGDRLCHQAMFMVVFSSRPASKSKNKFFVDCLLLLWISQLIAGEGKKSTFLLS